jgi:RNA polymerase sigma-70 factor (ECF subfamily)
MLAERERPLTDQLTQHQRELTGYCYRMLGSAFEAEDAVQETMVRAWRSYGRFEGRSSLRTWLYRIATNVCLDLLEEGRRRARPMDLSGPTVSPDCPGEPAAGTSWIEPVPDAWVLPAGGNPADVALARESVQLAFVAVLQDLPSLQRAVLLLREVLGLSGQEIADLLPCSLAAVNSALQRARATLAERQAGTRPMRPLTGTQAALLARFVDAFEQYDMDALMMLLHVDATLTLPPYSTWLRGSDQIRRWLLGPGVGCRMSRLVRTFANGSPAFGQYRTSESGQGFDPWALHVLEIRDGRICGLNAFQASDQLFAMFGLPARLDG